MNLPILPLHIIHHLVPSLRAHFIDSTSVNDNFQIYKTVNQFLNQSQTYQKAVMLSQWNETFKCI